MTYIDVLIPFFAGLLMLVFPQLFVKKTSSEGELAEKRAKFRILGSVLVGVALLYLLLKLARPHL